TRGMSAQATCPCSLWDSTATPAVVDEPDGNSVELGMRFQSSVAGYITAIRFYKSASNTGNHTGSIWSADGTWLGTVALQAETASGWQQAKLQQPIAIAANTTYIASYFAPVGHYSYTTGTFGSAGVTNGPLHALGSAESANGVFHYAAGGGFPDQD